MSTGWGESRNTIGFGKIYSRTWTGKYNDINVAGKMNDFRQRVYNDNGIIEGGVNLIKKFYKLFKI